MSDFAQNGLICTLQRLNDWHLPLIEDALCELAVKKPIALILPCHGVDLEKPALAHLVAEIAEGRPFLSEVVVSLNGITQEQKPRVAKIFATLPMATRFLWNDQPNALNGGLTGKGGNVAAAIRYITEDYRHPRCRCRIVSSWGPRPTLLCGSGTASRISFCENVLLSGDRPPLRAGLAAFSDATPARAGSSRGAPTASRISAQLSLPSFR